MTTPPETTPQQESPPPSFGMVGAILHSDLSECAILSPVNADDGFNVPLQWVGDLSSPPAPVNQVLIVADAPLGATGKSDAHVLNLGYVSAPVFPSGASREVLEQIASQPLPIFPAGRFMLTTARLRELRDVLTQHLELQGE